MFDLFVAVFVVFIGVQCYKPQGVFTPKLEQGTCATTEPGLLEVPLGATASAKVRAGAEFLLKAAARLLSFAVMFSGRPSLSEMLLSLFFWAICRATHSARGSHVS